MWEINQIKKLACWLQWRNVLVFYLRDIHDRFNILGLYSPRSRVSRSFSAIVSSFIIRKHVSTFLSHAYLSGKSFFSLQTNEAIIVIHSKSLSKILADEIIAWMKRWQLTTVFSPRKVGRSLPMYSLFLCVHLLLFLFRVVSHCIEHYATYGFLTAMEDCSLLPWAKIMFTCSSAIDKPITHQSSYYRNRPS